MTDVAPLAVANDSQRRVVSRWRFLHVVYRNYKVWRKTMISSLVTHLADPLIWLLGLGFGLGSLMPSVAGLSYLEFFGSGMICYGAMNSASFEALWSAFTRLKMQRTWESILNAPMTSTDVVIGEWLSAALKGVLSGIAILLAMAALGLVKSWSALWALPVVLLTGLAFASCALIVTALARSYDLFNFYFNLVIMPMMLISGVFFPMEQLPHAVQLVAQIFPLAHATTLARGFVVGAPLDHIALDVGVLCAYGAVGLLIANELIRKRLTR
ncbi:MAG TPA: ABC transporter permease [Steroidobacteraceae bacterium]|nr:ABC transporter permease [Steroidobacteraceae bacterium]